MDNNKIEKQTFTYPFLFRLIFRYGNFFVTLLLASYSLPLILYIDENLIFVIPLLVNFILIYFINKYYINNYNILPFNIEADDEKIVCAKFFLSKKKITINYSDISLLQGGSFENKSSGIMKVYTENNSICIGFHSRLNNSSKLVSYIISKVNRSLYEQVLEKISNKKKDYVS